MCITEIISLPNYEANVLAELISNNTNFRVASERLIAINNQLDAMKANLQTASSSIAEKIDMIEYTASIQSAARNQMMSKLTVLNELTNHVTVKMGIIEGGLNQTYVDQNKLENSEILQSERLLQNSNFGDKEKQTSLLSTPIAFFAQRNSSYGTPGSMIAYTSSQLNLGGSLNETSGIFTVPMRGNYYFYFQGLKTKEEICGTSRLTLQLIQLGKPNRMLAECHIDSQDKYGWFPVHLQTNVFLQKNDLVGIQLLEGSLHESGKPDHFLTGFGGFLVSHVA